MSLPSRPKGEYRSAHNEDMPVTAAHGRLLLVPNTLDFGVANQADLEEVLPLGVIRTAARVTHWVAENA